MYCLIYLWALSWPPLLCHILNSASLVDKMFSPQKTQIICIVFINYSPIYPPAELWHLCAFMCACLNQMAHTVHVHCVFTWGVLSNPIVLIKANQYRQMQLCSFLKTQMQSRYLFCAGLGGKKCALPFMATHHPPQSATVKRKQKDTVEWTWIERKRNW